MTSGREGLSTLQPDRQYEGQRRISGRSWISSLASPQTAVLPSSPPPHIPTINIDAHSPASTPRTVRLGHMPVPPSRTKQVMPGDLDSDSKESVSTHEDKDVTHIKYGMSTVDEGSEYPNSPMTPLTARVGGKARSIVDGLVSGIRNLPKAMTHSQIYDRRSSMGRESSRTSHFSGTDNRVTMTTDRDSTVAFKFHPPAPYPIPFVFAPPFPPPGMQQRMSLDHDPMSKLGSEGDAAEMDSEDTHLARITNLVTSFNRMPWISPTRVAVDYIPGSSRKTSVPPHKTKNSSSWYTMTAPASPSDISNPWETLPEPWFPPTVLPTTEEDPEAEERAGNDTETGQDQTRDESMKGNVEERLKELKEELQEKSRQLGDLRQIVEHQKMHISVLEGELAELRRAEEQDEHHRRRSSVRKSTLRARDSLGVPATARRTSVRVSRPGSSFFD
ncbi:hypothetical protein BC835DRAFT_1413242 [Cytidiella melzeri]|nr:hypothetical protein BC835DRAFT_1413242 [Cytidiella melzeri]